MIRELMGGPFIFVKGATLKEVVGNFAIRHCGKKN